MLRLHAVRKIIHAHPWTRTSLRRTNLHARACTWHVTAMRARGRRLPSYPNTPMVMRPRAHPGAMALCNRCRGSPRRPTGPRHTCYAQPGRRDVYKTRGKHKRSCGAPSAVPQCRPGRRSLLGHRWRRLLAIAMHVVRPRSLLFRPSCLRSRNRVCEALICVGRLAVYFS